MRDLELDAELDLAVAELRDCLIEILDAVEQDRLVALEMPGEQERGRIPGQPHHRHACPEGLDGERELRAQPTGEVVHVGGDVPAWQVDEVKPIEHSESLRGASIELRAGPSPRRISTVSVVKINAIPREWFAEFEERFVTRAGKVESAAGFEGFELLRPNDDREVCLVVTRWRSEEAFWAWVASSDFAAGHAQHREREPVGTTSELWPFDVLEREAR